WNRLRFVGGKTPQWKQISEFPFDSDVKKMSSIFEDSKTGSQWILTKGAVERIVPSCTLIKIGEKEVPMTDEVNEQIMANLEALARMGLRVLAFASRTGFRKVDAKENPDRSE